MEHGLVLEAGRAPLPDGHVAFPTRIESVGARLPERVVTTEELMAGLRHHTSIDLERLTGIRTRHVCSEGEDSFTLAVEAARDCLRHSRWDAGDMDMLLSCSITRYHGGLRHQWEPPLSLCIKDVIGAHRAQSFDLGNACAGMMSGVFVLHDFVRRGVIRRGMVVSGEYISNLSDDASKRIRWIGSRLLASLTLGDGGAAVIVERAEDPEDAIGVAGFVTLSEHSRLCLGAPSPVGPGASMATRARAIHRAAIEESPGLLQEALDASGLTFGDIDWVIPHQTSVRAIERGARELSEKLGLAPRHVVITVDELGNTSSTTHFIALHRYLRDHRFERGDRIMLLSFASGLEVGVVIFPAGAILERYDGCDD